LSDFFIPFSFKNIKIPNSQRQTEKTFSTISASLAQCAGTPSNPPREGVRYPAKPLLRHYKK